MADGISVNLKIISMRKRIISHLLTFCFAFNKKWVMESCLGRNMIRTNAAETRTWILLPMAISSIHRDGEYRQKIGPSMMITYLVTFVMGLHYHHLHFGVTAIMLRPKKPFLTRYLDLSNIYEWPVNDTLLCTS